MGQSGQISLGLAVTPWDNKMGQSSQISLGPAVTPWELYARPGYFMWPDCGPGPATWSWSCDCGVTTRDPGICIPLEMLAILSFGNVEKGGWLARPEDARDPDCVPGPATWSWSRNCGHMTRESWGLHPLGVQPAQNEVFRTNAPLAFWNDNFF